MLSESGRQLMKITVIQFFITATIARVLPQMDRQYQPRNSPDSRFGPGPILTPVKFLSISKLQNSQLAYDADRARANDLQNSVNNGGMQPEYLEPISGAPKRIRIELARGSNKRVSITHRSGRRIHFTLMGRQDSTQNGPRQMRVMFKNRPQSVAMDMPANSVNVNEFSSEPPTFRTAVGGNSETNPRGPSKIVLIRNNGPSRVPKRVIVRTVTGSGSPNRRVVRIHFVRNNNNKNDVIQRGATRPEITMPSTNMDQYPQVNRMNNRGNVETTSGSTQGQGQSPLQNLLQSQFQDQINGQVLAELKGKIESLLQDQLQGQLQGQIQGHLQGQPKGQASSSPFPAEVVDIEEPEIASSHHGKTAQATPTLSPVTQEQSTSLPVDAEAEEL
ncbi:uncharacterized protein LOC117314902 [Pecten maximus]|uniref:uncharacterized protein LOC117314902 n=1 Tax=Pecten maximus TaxID=6579 RepID=UPI0014584C5F|nr:uncharacterized protein LOC117314902 [Pecten maximus]